MLYITHLCRIGNNILSQKFVAYIPYPDGSGWRDWEFSEECTASDGCVTETDGVYKFNKDHFVMESNWPSNSIVAYGGHTIEVDFDLTGSGNFYLKGGMPDNKVTYKLNMPDTNIEYGIYFQWNDGALNDVIVKFLPCTYLYKSKVYMKGGEYYYTNKINYVFEYVLPDDKTEIDFSYYKHPI